MKFAIHKMRGFDIVCREDAQFIGLTTNRIGSSIDWSDFEYPGGILRPRERRIVGIGDREDKTAGNCGLIFRGPGDYVSYVGTLDDLVLFEVWKASRPQFVPKYNAASGLWQVPRTNYFQVYLALHDLNDTDFYISNHANTGRTIRKAFEFYELEFNKAAYEMAVFEDCEPDYQSFDW